jgi:hypothetical protein
MWGVSYGAWRIELDCWCSPIEGGSTIIKTLGDGCPIVVVEVRSA